MIYRRHRRHAEATIGDRATKTGSMALRVNRQNAYLLDELCGSPSVSALMILID
jgi:hypothetical protein